METAVCTHDSYDYNFAKDPNTLHIYADWLHAAFMLLLHYYPRVSLHAALAADAVTLWEICSP